MTKKVRYTSIKLIFDEKRAGGEGTFGANFFLILIVFSKKKSPLQARMSKIPHMVQLFWEGGILAKSWGGHFGKSSFYIINTFKIIQKHKNNPEIRSQKYYTTTLKLGTIFKKVGVAL